jgi:hypothetical protein
MFRTMSNPRAVTAAATLLCVAVALAITASAAFGGPRGAKTAIRPAASQTRSTSCGPFDFQPVESDTQADYANAKRIRKGTSGTGFFSCNPSLPTRAVVTKVQFSVWDGSGSSQLKYCGLYRSGLTGPTSDNVQELAAVPGTGIDQAPGFARLSDTSIRNATIDTGKYVYWLQCNLEQSGQSLGLFGADVLYTITGANG